MKGDSQYSRWYSERQFRLARQVQVIPMLRRAGINATIPGTAIKQTKQGDPQNESTRPNSSTDRSSQNPKK